MERSTRTHIISPRLTSTGSLSAERRKAFDTFGDGQGRAPLVSQNVEAYATVGVDVWVVDTRSEINLGRLEWVVGREVYGEEEDPS